MRAALLLSAIITGCTLAGATGCTQHEVKVSAPQLDSVGEAVKKIVVEDCKPTKYAMKPIPQDVEIDIKGDKVKANDGGILLLKEYVAARKLLK